MKTVKIPECMSPFEVTVNNHHYRYPAGTTQEVPDEVAEIIDVHMKNHADMTAPPYVPGGGVVGTCKFRLIVEGNADSAYGTVVLVDGKNTTIDLNEAFGTTEYEIPCGSVILKSGDAFNDTTNLTTVWYCNCGSGTAFVAPSEPGAVATLRQNFTW